MDRESRGGESRSVCILCHRGAEAGPLVREQCTGRKFIHEPACVHDACKEKALADLSAIDSAQEGRSRRKRFQNTMIKKKNAKKNAMDTLCVFCLQRSGGLENLSAVKTSFMKHYARRAECFDSALERVCVEERKPSAPHATPDGRPSAASKPKARPTRSTTRRRDQQRDAEAPSTEACVCQTPTCTRRARSSGMCYACETQQRSFDRTKRYLDAQETARPAVSAAAAAEPADEWTVEAGGWAGPAGPAGPPAGSFGPAGRSG